MRLPAERLDVSVLVPRAPARVPVFRVLVPVRVEV